MLTNQEAIDKALLQAKTKGEPIIASYPVIGSISGYAHVIVYPDGTCKEHGSTKHQVKK